MVFIAANASSMSLIMAFLLNFNTSLTETLSITNTFFITLLKSWWWFHFISLLNIIDYCISFLRIEGRFNDRIMLRLIEAHCIPILSYRIVIVHMRDWYESRIECSIQKIVRLRISWKRPCTSAPPSASNVGRYHRIEIVAFSKLFSNVIRMRELAMIMGTINIDARLAFHLLYFFVVLNSICSAFVPTLLF